MPGEFQGTLGLYAEGYKTRHLRTISVSDSFLLCKFDIRHYIIGGHKAGVL